MALWIVFFILGIASLILSAVKGLGAPLVFRTVGLILVIFAGLLLLLGALAIGHGAVTCDEARMLTVACVYRTGGAYTATDVSALEQGIRRHIGEMEHRFLVLTDRPAEIEQERFAGEYHAQALEDYWPGWWSKLNVFRIPGPVLYFDLDTAIVGDIDPLADAVLGLRPETLMMLRGFYRGDKCSGIMGWTGDFRWLAERFEKTVRLEEFHPPSGAPARHVATVGRRHFHGDQDWIAENVAPTVMAQDLFPGIYSYKVHVRNRELPPDARIVCFHGVPKPRDLRPAPAWMQPQV